MPDCFLASSTRLCGLHGGSAARKSADLGGGAILGLFGGWAPPSRLTLPIADRVRAALMRASRSAVPWQISGKDAGGRPRRGHDHLYVLPFSSVDARDRGPRLDRVLLWAEGGLADATVAVIERLGKQGGWVGLRGRSRLRLELLGLGSRDVLARGEAARLLGPARRWRSATSFVAPRFPKRRRARELDAPREQLCRLAADVLGHPIEELASLRAPADDWGAFEQRRSKQPAAARRPASGWIVQFPEPVPGPIALGYGAHFGLGRFAADKISDHQGSIEPDPRRL